MSQYPYNPSPYQPPTPDYAAWPMMLDPRRPARIAAILQIILGTILALPFTCLGTLMLVARPQVSQMFQSQMSNIQLPPGMSINDFVLALLVLSVLVVLAGLILIVLAFFVRRGSRAASIVSISLTGIIALILLMGAFKNLAQLASSPSLQTGMSVIFSGICLALCGSTIVKLLSVLRLGQHSGLLAAQQAQYWAMMQQQAGYGYGYPPPPPTGAAPIAPPPGGPQNPPPPAPPV